MRDRQPSFYCISAQTAGWAHLCQHVKLGAKLKALDLPHKQVRGRYKGTSELSYIVVTDHSASLLALAKEFGQESILYVDGYRQAWLLSAYDGTSEYLGTWREVYGNKEPDGDYTERDGVYYEVAA